MTLAETALAVLLLLVAPGPTNTLVALGGAERGWPRGLGLLSAEVAGYLMAVLPLVTIGNRLVESAPVLRVALGAAAATWVLWLAVAMWRRPAGPAGAAAVTGRQILLTTILNPKALVFGLVVLPAAEGERLVANLATFVALVVAVGCGWSAAGAMARQAGPGAAGLPLGWRRAASLWLGALGAWLLGHLAGLA